MRADPNRALRQTRTGSRATARGLLSCFLAVGALAFHLPAADRWSGPARLVDTALAQSDPGRPAEAPPGARVAEDVAAVVGDTPILRSEVEEQVQMIAEQRQISPSDTAAYNELHRLVLDRLIDDQVLLREAEAQDIKAPPEEVDQLIEQKMQENIRQFGNREALLAQLQKQGMTEQELRTRLREDVRKQILASRLVQKEVRPKVNLPPDAGRKFFEANRTEIPKKPRSLRIQDLFIRTRPDSVLAHRAHERALDVRQKIADGLPFADAAAKFSDDPRGKEGGSLGRFEKGELDSDLEQAAFSLGVGEVSQPVTSRFGIHLVKVTDKDPAGAWVEASHILFAVTPSRSDEEQARERAEDIYQQVTSGKLDFVEAIRRHSEDPDSRSRDGDMGWIPIDGFYGDMRAVVDTLRVGRISRPVSGDGGFHVFKVTGEQAESTYSFDEIEEQMKQYAAQEAMEKELRGWLDQLRKKYFVEIRKAW